MRQSSPFAAENRQDQLEKWICRQHRQQELPLNLPIEADEEKHRPNDAADSAVQPPIVQTMIQPQHRQYDAVISRMRTARKQAGADQQWSG